jgi:TolB protein
MICKPTICKPMKRTMCTALALFFAATCFGEDSALGIFTNSADIGKPAIPGAATYANGDYRITGAGENIWGKRDQFHYVWREFSGDFELSATMKFLGNGAEHRKAGIMLRQSLDPSAAYADVVIHGSGMPALQWRSSQGDDTDTFDFPVQGPGDFKIKLVRSGVKIYLYAAKGDDELKKMANTEVSFQSPVLIGLFVCSHHAEASDTAVFSNVSIKPQEPAAPKVK